MFPMVFEVMLVLVQPKTLVFSVPKIESRDIVCEVQVIPLKDMFLIVKFKAPQQLVRFGMEKFVKLAFGNLGIL